MDKSSAASMAESIIDRLANGEWNSAAFPRNAVEMLDGIAQGRYTVVFSGIQSDINDSRLKLLGKAYGLGGIPAHPNL